MREIGAHTLSFYAFKMHNSQGWDTNKLHANKNEKSSFHSCIALKIFYIDHHFIIWILQLSYSSFISLSLFFRLKIYIFIIHHKINVVEEAKKTTFLVWIRMLACFVSRNKRKHITVKNNNNKMMFDGMFVYHAQHAYTQNILVDFKRKIKSI